jgi:septum formation protein
MKLILASASPRRAHVLVDAGIRFDVLVTEADETRRPNEDVEAMTRRLAEAKARAAVEKLVGLREPALVLGADTAVELDGEVFGKPGSAGAAREMLRRLSGRSHRVVTGVAMIRLPDGIARFAVESTKVCFASLTPEEIEQYAVTDEPLDKAGAYAIQGFGGRFVERVEGCYFNVVGLPLSTVYRALVELGWRSDSARLMM